MSRPNVATLDQFRQLKCCCLPGTADASTSLKGIGPPAPACGAEPHPPPAATVPGEPGAQPATPSNARTIRHAPHQVPRPRRDPPTPTSLRLARTLGPPSKQRGIAEDQTKRRCRTSLGLVSHRDVARGAVISGRKVLGGDVE